MYKKLFFGVIGVNIIFSIFYFRHSLFFKYPYNQSISLNTSSISQPSPSQLKEHSFSFHQPKVKVKPPSSSKKIFLRRDTFNVKTTATPKILSVKDETGDVRFFDPVSKKYTLEEVFKTYSGGGLYIGQSNPLISSTHRLIAYINLDDNNIWVMDVDGNNKNKISLEGHSETDTFFGSTVSLTAWSDDERFLVYHATPGEGGPGSGDKLILPMLTGFYVADLQEGGVYYLPGVQGVVAFIPQTHQLILANDGTQLSAFNSWNILTDEIKTITKKTFSSWTGQLTFSKNGYMAYSYGTTNNDSNVSFSALVYAALDNTNQREIARGSWAEVQWPTISSDGKWIAYIKETPALCASGTGGCPKGTLFLYNTTTGQKEQVLENIKSIRYWYDDENLLILRGSHERPWSLEFFNITNQTSIAISSNEAL